jgi:hypothetical protein
VTRPAPPDARRRTAGRGANGRFLPGFSGNPAKRFTPGTSGNPSGRPKAFSVHQIVAEALEDGNTRSEAIKRLQDNLKRGKTVVNTLEFAARVNREIGLGAEDRPAGVTMNFVSNIRPGSLRRQPGTGAGTLGTQNRVRQQTEGE